MSGQEMNNVRDSTAFGLSDELDDKGKARTLCPAKTCSRASVMPDRNRYSDRSSRRATQMTVEEKESLRAFVKDVDDDKYAVGNCSPSRPRTLSLQALSFTIEEPKQNLEQGFDDIDLGAASPPQDDCDADESYLHASAFADYEDDDDWEMLEKDELKEEPRSANTPDGAIYQSPSFRSAFQKHIDRYKLSPEQQRSLQGALAVLEFVGEFGYAVVSEPVLDAAHWVVQRQFGVELDELPKELKSRALASLPQPIQNTLLSMQHAARVTNSLSGRSVMAAASSCQLQPEVSGQAFEAARRTIASITKESMHIVDRHFEHPTIGNDMRDEELKDVEFVDELEGMNVGVP